MKFPFKTVVIASILAVVYMRNYPQTMISHSAKHLTPNEVQCFKDYMHSDELLQLAHQSSLLTNLSELESCVRVWPLDESATNVIVDFNAGRVARWKLKPLLKFWFNAIDNFNASKHCPTASSSAQTPSP